MTYSFLLESVWHPPLIFAEDPTEALPLELELQALWFSGAFGKKFQSVCGKEIHIVQFGEWNRGAGPDFRQAAVEIDGELHHGPIELDRKAQDWDAHGHAENPAFREVILHVAFRSDHREIFTRTVDHRHVPQVIIQIAAVNEALNRPLRETAIAHPGRCFAPLKGMSKIAIERLLKEAAMLRAAAKFKHFSRVAAAHSADAALYHATAETLGYRSNSLAMCLLAQRVPLALLKVEPDLTEAVLFGTAGFLNADVYDTVPQDSRAYLRQLWDAWWKNRSRFEVSAERKIPWVLHGQRPANHPQRRIAALVAITHDWARYRQLALASPFSTKNVVDFLHALPHAFWRNQHTLTSEPTAQPISLFGRQHALELVANHLAPLALHEKRMTFYEYYKVRNSAANDKVKRCAIRLFGSLDQAKPWTKRVCHHQALLQIYRDFCLEDVSNCQRCPFPEQLSQWR